MSEDTQVSVGESEETTDNTGGSEAQNTKAGEATSSGSDSDTGEGKENATAFDESLLEIGKEDSKSPQSTQEERDANYNKSTQIDVWFDRIANGKINPKTDEEYSLDEAPSWVSKAVEKKLDDLSNPAEPITRTQSDDVDFKLLKREIPELPKSKQEALASKFKEFKSAGIKSDYIALKNALEFVKVSTESEKRGAKAARMKVHGGGSAGGINVSKDTGEPSPDFLKRHGISPEDAKKIKNFNFLNPNQK